MATRILAFGVIENGKVLDYKGDYKDFTDYCSHYLALNINNQTSFEKETQSKSDFIRQKKLLSEQRKFLKKIEKSKEESKQIEQRLSKIEEEISLSETNHSRLSELFEEKEILETKLLDIYEFLSKNSDDF